MSNEELYQLVHDCVEQVGPTWGRRMVQGYLRSKGHDVGLVRIKKTLRLVDRDATAGLVFERNPAHSIH